MAAKGLKLLFGGRQNKKKLSFNQDINLVSLPTVINQAVLCYQPKKTGSQLAGA